MHYWAKADNARFCAYSLWTAAQDERKGEAQKVANGRSNEHVSAIAYGGAPWIALNEGYRREASIALELIIKAVIAQRIEGGVASPQVTKVRTTHHLASLWNDAMLPALPREDQHRLLIAQRILFWAGRYAAPKKDEDYEKESEAMMSFEDRRDSGTFKIVKGRSFSWDDVDRIYQIAAASLWEIRSLVQ
jgi:hypothetical protein